MSADIYRSNDGAGPYLARVINVENGVVTMVRWKESDHNNNHNRTFKLPEWFLSSPACGWRKVP